MRKAVFAWAILLGSQALWGCAASAPKPPPSAPSSLVSGGAPELGRPALSASASDGRLVLLRDLRGRLVIVDFFAEYCQPCLRTLPDLVQLGQSRPEVSIVGIAEDPDAQTSLRLVQQLELTFPVVYDRDHVLAGRYRVGGLPATFVLDRAGVVRWASDGACQRSELEAVLDSLK